MGQQIRAKIVNLEEWIAPDLSKSLGGELDIQIVNSQGFCKRELVFSNKICHFYYGFDTLHYFVRVKGYKFIFADPLTPKGYENKLIIKVEPDNFLKKLWWKLRRYNPIYHD